MDRDARYWTEVEELFDAAVDLEAAERAALLDARCPDRPDLRAEVESLVEAHLRAEQLQPSHAEPDPTPIMPSPGPGSVIGSFRLVEPIGAGGMATVYRAERADGTFEQQVAIKLIATPVSQAGAARRFRVERQILASLGHPNIVGLIDGGITPEGYAYLVMEYVEGKPLDRYCRDRNLPLADRLGLFRSVCSAVHYAHRHAIVHRDLKPANILVTPEGVPKVLDFGVAKLLDESAVAGATATGLGVGPMTPNYASPEQLRGLPLTTSSDVYALGVLLYELVAGVRPYETGGKPLDEVMRLVVEAEPPRPSATLAVRQSGLPYDPRRTLKGDLDAVILRAMSKAPERRYGSAEELAGDVARYLAGTPVAAREPSFGYVVRKLAARHKAAVVSASVSLVAIVAALILAIWQARIATAERDRAQAEAAKAQQVAAFLRTLFSGAYPKNRVPGATLSAQDLLDRGAGRVDQELGGQPDVQASMLALLSSVYTEMGLYQRALPLGERSLALREKLFGPEHGDVAESLHRLGRLKRLQGEFEAAQPLLERAVKIREQRGRPDDPLLAEALSELGTVFWYRGRPEGRVHLERAVAIEERAGGPQLSRWLTALSNFDLLIGDLDSQQKLLERALEVGVRAEGRPGFLVSVTILNLGEVLRAQEDYGRARPLLEQALEIAVQLYGTEHQATVYNWAELGELYFAMGDHRKAREFLDRSITVGERILGRDHIGLAAPLTYSGRLLLAEGRPKEALPLIERAIRVREKAHGQTNSAIAENLVDIARVTMRLEGIAAGEPILRRALAMQREALVPGHRSLVPTLTSLAEVLSARNEQVEALGLLNEAVQIARARLPPRHSQRLQAEAALERRQAAGSKPLSHTHSPLRGTSSAAMSIRHASLPR